MAKEVFLGMPYQYQALKSTVLHVLREKYIDETDDFLLAQSVETLYFMFATEAEFSYQLSQVRDYEE